MKLVKFLQKLNRESVTIELKNGTVVQGIVVGVDATMNCHLRKVTVTLYVGVVVSICCIVWINICVYSNRSLLHSLSCSFSRGKNPVSFATLSVRGSTMRTWILPESLNLDALLVDDEPKRKAPVVPSAAPGRSMGRGRGRGRGGGRR